MAKKTRCVVSPSPDLQPEEATLPPIGLGLQLDEVKEPSPSPKTLPSSSGSSHQISPIPIPNDVLLQIAYCLHDAEHLGTLSSLSLLNKASHNLAAPILFVNITVRNHRQLASILSSLGTLRADQGKRKTRLSGPKCDVQAKLARFALTKHLSINHFPSLDNLARLAALEEVFNDEPIFTSLETMTLAPILMHRLHPGACGTAAAQTKERLKTIYLLRLLAHPAHLTVDIRGAEPGWTSLLSDETPHGCVCIDDFCSRIGRIWIAKRSIKELVIHVDTDILATHYFSTSANGPALDLIVRPTTEGQSSQSKARGGRKAKAPSSSKPVPKSTTDAIGSFLYHRVLQADEHRGGETTITILGDDGKELDVDEVSREAREVARDMAGENKGIFKGAKAKAMLQAIVIEYGMNRGEEAHEQGSG